MAPFDENLKLVFLVRVPLLQVKPIIPSTPELQKWEDLDKGITCLITIIHQSPLCCRGKQIYDGRRVPLKMRVTTVARFLCAVTDGPHPSGLPADFNLKPLNDSGIAPAD
jgi:hypothetical protein